MEDWKPMSRIEWHAARVKWTEREKQERSEDWQASRAPLQAAITEQAIRDCFGRIAALEEALRGK